MQIVFREEDDTLFIIDFTEIPEDFSEVSIENDRIIYTLSARHYIRAGDEPTINAPYFLAIRAISTHPLFLGAKKAGLRGTARLWLDDRPRGPGLAFSCSINEDSSLIPDSTFLLNCGYSYPRSQLYLPWVERKRTIFWRGTSSGFPQKPWYALPRAAMCLVVRDDPNFDAGISATDNLVSLKEFGIYKQWVDYSKYSEYRHVIDIDGNSSSWSGLFTKLLFGCTVLKIISDQRQWYYDRLIAWEHYVPVTSIEELSSIGELAMAHEPDCEKIAFAGQELARSITFDAAIEDGISAIAEELARN